MRSESPERESSGEVLVAGWSARAGRQRQRASVWRSVLIGTGITILVLAPFMVWAAVDRASLAAACVEDGPIENLSAILLALAALGFFVAAGRSSFLRRRQGRWRYVPILAWGMLMVVFCGEEISWGQRIFNFGTPDVIRSSNKQREFNLHNIYWVDSAQGGAYRWLTLMMLTTGILLPAIAATRTGRQAIRHFSFPVSPAIYAGVFAGSFLFGKYYYPLLKLNASEVRELIFSIGMACFAVHGAVAPWALFRLRPGDETGDETP